MITEVNHDELRALVSKAQLGEVTRIPPHLQEAVREHLMDVCHDSIVQARKKNAQALTDVVHKVLA